MADAEAVGAWLAATVTFTLSVAVSWAVSVTVSLKYRSEAVARRGAVKVGFAAVVLDSVTVGVMVLPLESVCTQA